MFRPLTLVAMRQEQGDAGHAAPLRFPRTDELIDDDLRTVAEVAELAFPYGQATRLGGGESVLESHHGQFGQHRIGYREFWLIRSDVLQGHVRAPGGLVMQHGVAVKKRTAAAVLSGETNRI